MRIFFFCCIILFAVSIGIHIFSILGIAIDTNSFLILSIHLAAMAAYFIYFFILTDRHKIKEKIKILPTSSKVLIRVLGGYSLVLMLLLFYSSTFDVKSFKIFDLIIAYDWENNLPEDSYNLRLNGVCLFSAFWSSWFTYFVVISYTDLNYEKSRS